MKLFKNFELFLKPKFYDDRLGHFLQALILVVDFEDCLMELIVAVELRMMIVGMVLQTILIVMAK